MNEKDFLTALQALGERAGRDLTPGDGATFDYEFDDGLACTVGYLDDGGCGLMVAAVGALPHAAKKRLAVCELLLQWNDALNHAGDGRLSVGPDGERVQYSLVIGNSGLETERLESLFTGFFDQAAAFRAHLQELEMDDTAETSADATPVHAGSHMIKG